jgi:hypothetical protein
MKTEELVKMPYEDVCRILSDRQTLILDRGKQVRLKQEELEKLISLGGVHNLCDLLLVSMFNKLLPEGKTSLKMDGDEFKIKDGGLVRRRYKCRSWYSITIDENRVIEKLFDKDIDLLKSVQDAIVSLSILQTFEKHRITLDSIKAYKFYERNFSWATNSYTFDVPLTTGKGYYGRTDTKEKLRSFDIDYSMDTYLIDEDFVDYYMKGLDKVEEWYIQKIEEFKKIQSSFSELLLNSQYGADITAHFI